MAPQAQLSLGGDHFGYGDCGHGGRLRLLPDRSRWWISSRERVLPSYTLLSRLRTYSNPVLPAVRWMDACAISVYPWTAHLHHSLCGHDTDVVLEVFDRRSGGSHSLDDPDYGAGSSFWPSTHRCLSSDTALRSIWGFIACACSDRSNHLADSKSSKNRDSDGWTRCASTLALFEITAA